MDQFRDSSEGIYVKRRQSRDRRCVIICVVSVGIAAFVIGILIGRFATCPDEETPEERSGVFLEGVTEKLMKDADPEVSDILIKGMRAENIRENLRMLTEKPHLGGTEENHELGRKLKKFWEDNGFDHVTMAPYEVLLSYPNMSNLNFVELLDGEKTVYKSNLTEPILTPEEDKPDVVPPFNAYSPAGDVKGDVVYVNYGRVEDFQFLERNMSINVTGKIVLARYGKIFRGNKVRHAEEHGAIGIILYSDPDDITAGDIDKVYPDDWWLPPSGAQRGSIYIGVGDPLTPGYPAIATAYRRKDPEEWMPGIPCHPVGYGIAVQIMSELGGKVVKEQWKGKMNTTYRYGGTFKTPNWKARIFVSTKDKMVTTYNTIGVIRGSIEPDRYVLVGNHRDAWVFGALDPSSGTAVMMEMSRVMGQLVKSGKWRPRRSILFCSWGAEEYGLVGSIEWVEHYTKTLGARAIAYLNVDIAVEGNFSLRALGTPLIFKSLYEATKKVPNPNPTEVNLGRTTIYDTWMSTFPWTKYNRPMITLPGSGSDYAPFRDRIGIPNVDIRFTWDKRNLKLSAYPMYHSVYETFYLVDKIMDIGFKHHKALGQIWVEMARDLADSLILPFNVSDYSDALRDLSDNLLDHFGPLMTENNVNTNDLKQAVFNFTEAVHEFEKIVKDSNLNDPFVVRRINDQLMDIDRAFIDPFGLPGRKYKRNIIFTESSIDSYAGSSFPGLSDALTLIEQKKDVEKQWEIAKKHYSVVLYSIQGAATILKDVSNFMYDY
ncbi:N-acetylated-alpha-linked acidic dipeptidase 2-like [Ruditapes philippinarum]|uniref:N-acetylated-alpha-linked acidic dipeptidase 2-like n=1 Tax=Ruditapes philippinarum TaxID=129788 RepID=UPI00295AB839|nr:N-acetylated-alpha-linked acidic dipeptidase 2-like [Ruditapes philippinarum]XP_060559270.1 N-acetylated-alpha-linked acidic dipeptidase 2-like [Ruditapes philippinarum]XP_060559271.1 N-acetylated-alpha-linked acidic dipeptidase 2-like [Ruditapes philippinarum]XP_060559273.1 N-acetylated-alpha-linked acidic dipeptidase 2-like [Ruditapes philippinarum]XP_060559274.1 N-acetylated-alpha-linked acidic dipeptidase 2-like [Ruditapes philippinarum]XP_060559275.1 N-acetylated-alpha-linked acidic di